jgi:hypothetical protein
MSWEDSDFGATELRPEERAGVKIRIACLIRRVIYSFLAQLLPKLGDQGRLAGNPYQ